MWLRRGCVSKNIKQGRSLVLMANSTRATRESRRQDEKQERIDAEIDIQSSGK